MPQIQAFVLDYCACYKCIYVCMYVHNTETGSVIRKLNVRNIASCALCLWNIVADFAVRSVTQLQSVYARPACECSELRCIQVVSISS